MKNTTVALWGDSIGRGVLYDEVTGRYRISPENLCVMLQKDFGRNVRNYARMAATAKDGLARMTPDRMEQGGIAVLQFGGNDCDLDWKAVSKDPAAPHQPRLQLAEFRSTLRTLVERAQLNHMTPVLITPPPVDSERYFKWISRNLNAENILKFIGDIHHMYRWQERYANAVTSVAHDTGAKLIDLRDAFLAEYNIRKLLCSDGIHPNERGYQLINEIARQALAL